MRSMNDPLITLTTDFGLRDPYVAEMKGVILKICPDANVVDITHQIDKFDIRMGSFVLASAIPYFQDGAIHVAIVDPGVGTERRAVIVHTENCLLVGPDNGILALAISRLKGEKRVFAIKNGKLMLRNVSHTFHGRDIFAPAAAHLANRIPASEFGSEISDLELPEFSKISRRRTNELVGQIIHIDDFGNLVTNFTQDELPKLKNRLSLKLGETRLVLRMCRAYGEVRKQQPVAIIGSHDFLEISVNQGNAARKFKAKVGDEVVLKSAPKRAHV